MSSAAPNVVLVTGASSGIGRAIAEHLHRRGFRVYGASRKPPEAPFPTLAMDVDDDRSVTDGVAHVLEREGRIDAVVNNAGFALLGAIEDTSVAEAKQQFETNFFGVLRVCRAVLPHMRARRRGSIVNISSLGGVFAMPFSGMYSATKFALEGLSEALRHEVRPHGVWVTLIEPGDFKSNFTTARRLTAEAQTNDAYREALARAGKLAEKDEQNAPTPEPIALRVESVLRSRAPSLRHSVGMFGQRIVLVLRRWLPAALFERVIAGAFGLR